MTTPDWKRRARQFNMGRRSKSGPDRPVPAFDRSELPGRFADPATTFDRKLRDYYVNMTQKEPPGRKNRQRFSGMLDEVKALLAACNLPYDDLTPAHMADFLGTWDNQRLIAVVGLEVLGADALLRSLAVAETARYQGLGSHLVEVAEQEARGRGVQRIYLLTTTAASLFGRLGYRVIPRSEAPPAIRGTAEFQALCPDSAVLMLKEMPV